jgi:uncharacterized protein YbjT (DUF2867 family)
MGGRLLPTGAMARKCPIVDAGNGPLQRAVDRAPHDVLMNDRDARTALVTGVTGAQGGATARQLRRAGWRVRGLTRNPGSRRARVRRDQGIELVSGDLDDRSTLIAAMRGVDSVYGITPMVARGYNVERELQQGIMMAEAAARVGVSCFVFSSSAGAQDRTGVPHIDVKGAIEDRIHKLGLPATIVRPNEFGHHSPQLQRMAIEFASIEAFLRRWSGGSAASTS